MRKISYRNEGRTMCKLFKFGLVTIALSMALGLIACAPSVDKTAFLGSWVLNAGSDEALNAETIALARSMGSDATILLNEDGTGTLDLYGDISNLSWEANANNEGTLKVDDTRTATIKIEDEKLIVSDRDGGNLTFARP